MNRGNLFKKPEDPVYPPRPYQTDLSILNLESRSEDYTLLLELSEEVATNAGFEISSGEKVMRGDLAVYLFDLKAAQSKLPDFKSVFLNTLTEVGNVMILRHYPTHQARLDQMALEEFRKRIKMVQPADGKKAGIEV